MIEAPLLGERDLALEQNAARRIANDKLSAPAPVEDTAVVLDPTHDPFEVYLFTGAIEGAVCEEENAPLRSSEAENAPLRISPHPK